MISNVLFNLEANYCGQKLIILSFYNRQLPCSRIKVVCSFCVCITLERNIIWASMRENLSAGVCKQHRRRPACASAQSDQRLCCSLFEKYHV